MATKKEQTEEIKGNLGKFREISPNLEEVPAKSWEFPPDYTPIDIDSEIDRESMEEV